MGYPDFQTPVLWRGPILVNQTAWPLTTVNPFSGGDYVNNYNAVHIRVVPPGTNAGWQATLSFYTDSTLATFIGSYQWTGTAGQILSCSAPVLGDWVVLGVTTGVAGTQNTLIMMQAMNLPAAAVRYTAVGNAVEYVNQAVVASGSVNAQMPFVAEGPGYLYFSPRDATGKLTATVWRTGEGGGQITKIASISGPTTEQYLQFFGSNGPIVVFVNNADAAGPHSFDLRCCIDGR